MRERKEKERWGGKRAWTWRGKLVVSWHKTWSKGHTILTVKEQKCICILRITWLVLVLWKAACVRRWSVFLGKWFILLDSIDFNSVEGITEKKWQLHYAGTYRFMANRFLCRTVGFSAGSIQKCSYCSWGRETHLKVWWLGNWKEKKNSWLSDNYSLLYVPLQKKEKS